MTFEIAENNVKMAENLMFCTKLFLIVLGFEHRASHLLDRCSSTCATLLVVGNEIFKS
jgi:hypothetical protein